ncbi:MAG: peptidoglycan-binding protein [Pseudomonadota bacterium]
MAGFARRFILTATLVGTAIVTPTAAMSFGKSLAPRPDIPSALIRVDVIGKDQRVRVPKSYEAVSRGIGFLWQRGSGRACTAFCVSDSVIATNAHCLVDHARRKQKHLHLFRFMLAPPRGQVRAKDVTRLLYADRARPLLSFYTGAPGNQRSVKNMVDDWAFAKLAAPLCKGRKLAFKHHAYGKLKRAARKGRLLMIGYHGDRDLDYRWLSDKCDVQRGKRADLVFHTCDTFKGSSGSPILMRRNGGGYDVVAINVGTYELSRYRIMRSKRRNGRYRTRRKLVSRKVVNVAVPPEKFVVGLDRFANERLLKSASELREIQSSLRLMRLYDGQIDGIIGPRTRRAINAFERKEGLPAIGVPTQELRQFIRDRQSRGLRVPGTPGEKTANDGTQPAS